jgi:DNA mismatch endonuclease, patch repair protein
MSRIRSQNTKPEIKVRSILHLMGFRFRLHLTDLPGRPDIVLPKYHTVIFVHGCFWHRHAGCKYAYSPKSRQDFWQNKFEQNKARDRKIKASLKSIGWNIIIVWECELEKLNKLKSRLFRTLQGKRTKADEEHRGGKQH